MQWPADGKYLRDCQYHDTSKLNARVRLHAEYGRGDWLHWLAALADWPADAAVLDIGCGSGSFWTASPSSLSDQLAITLADLSPGMVGEAIRRVQGMGRWRRVHGLVANAENLPCSDESFDAVICIHMLYHVADPGRAIAEIRRVLRRGGTALVATNGLSNMTELLELRRSVFGGEAVDPGAAAFGIEAAGPVLREFFGEVELVRYPDELRCTNAEHVVAYILSLPPGDSASEEQTRQLRSVVAEAFARNGGILTVRKDVGVFRCRAT